jgi:starch-binding outer membrane protein, SusD/RagB family
MMNEESTGNKTFDAELCKQAAAAFADAINVCSTTGAYKLQPWATWTDIFWLASNTAINGGTEVIMNPTVYLRGRTGASTVLEYIPIPLGGSNTETPTHNYVKNYGMANGLPIDDPNSGFNPNDPWINREPRFYKDIIVDGNQMVKSTAAGIDQFAQLYNGGRHKGGTLGSVTGYYHKKWAGYGINKWDNLTTYQSYVPFMRLPDVYLMYAESVLQGYGTAQSSVPGSITAEAAVNVIRNRAQLPNLTSAYTATKDKFMEVIIRERAVELAFEGQRWFDLRRWNLAGETKYTEKTAIDFDRAANGKPINLKERVLVTRVFDKKHNWLPFQVNYTLLYKDFPQNPGW